MANNEQDTTLINHKVTIARFMREMAAHKTALTISTVKQERPRNYNTAVVRVDADGRSLILHQLTPGDWRDCMHRKEVVRVKCTLPNGILEFSSTVSPFEEDEDWHYCRLNFPKQISKHQLRSFFRVSLIGHEAEISMTLASDLQVRGKCLDISLGGGQGIFHLSQSNLTVLRSIDTIDACRLSIPGALDVEVACKVCRTQAAKDHRVIVGFKFLELSSAQAQALMRAIVKLERQQLQSYPPLTAS